MTADMFEALIDKYAVPDLMALRDVLGGFLRFDEVSSLGCLYL